VVGGDAVAHEAERGGQAVDHVHAHVFALLQQRLGGVEAGRAGADDGHAHRGVHGTFYHGPSPGRRTRPRRRPAMAAASAGAW
jgi:hypothetical protein